MTTTQPNQWALRADVFWKTTASLLLLVAAALIHRTGSINTCTDTGLWYMIGGWLIAPALGIAALATVAYAAPKRSEQRHAAALASVLTIGWLIALIAADIGPTIAQTTC